MSIHAALSHITHYKYDRPVSLGPQVIRLRPAPHCRSKIISYSLKIDPVDHYINWQQDPFANYQGRLVFDGKTTEFKVTVDLVVEMVDLPGRDELVARIRKINGQRDPDTDPTPEELQAQQEADAKKAEQEQIQIDTLRAELENLKAKTKDTVAAAVKKAKTSTTPEYHLK